MFPQMGPLISAAILAAIGFGMIASGEVFLAIREIALNTRSAVVPEDFQGARTKYAVSRVMLGLNNVLGALMIIVSAFLVFSSLK